MDKDVWEVANRLIQKKALVKRNIRDVVRTSISDRDVNLVDHLGYSRIIQPGMTQLTPGAAIHLAALDTMTSRAMLRDWSRGTAGVDENRVQTLHVNTDEYFRERIESQDMSILPILSIHRPDNGYLRRGFESYLAERGRGGDDQARNSLVEFNMPGLMTQGKPFFLNTHAGDDIVQEASIGGIEAANRFTGEKGAQYLTYASWWVRRSCLRNLGGSFAYHVPAHSKQLYLAIGRVIAHQEEYPPGEFLYFLGREIENHSPVRLEITEREHRTRKLTPAKEKEILRHVADYKFHHNNLTPLDKLISAEGREQHEQLAHDQPGQESDIEFYQLVEQIDTGISGFAENQQIFIRAYLGLSGDETYGNAAKSAALADLSRERGRQLKNKMRDALKGTLTDAGYIP